jgi:hypothetical protein
MKKFVCAEKNQRKIVMTVFKSSKMMFLNSKKSFQSMDAEYSMRRDLEASKPDVLKTFQKQF